MSIVCKVDPEAVASTIAVLLPARIAYERRRADHAGLDLETYLARKPGRTPLAVTDEELIAACEKRDSLVVPTASRVLCKDPEAFRIVQSKVSKLEQQVRLHLKHGVKPDIQTSEEKSADVTVSDPPFCTGNGECRGKVARKYLERIGELGDAAAASRFLSDTIETMIRRGQRSRLALSNRAIITYQRHRSSGAVGVTGAACSPA